MNTFTLRFLDDNLEKAFQSKKRESYQFKFLLIMSAATNIVLILNILENYKDQSNLMMNDFKIGVIIYIFLQAIYVYNKRQYTDKALFIINIFCFAPAVTQRNDHNIYDAHLQGQNQMLIQVMILIMSSLPNAITANILLCVARLVLIIYRSQNPYIYQFVFSIFATILMCGVSYVVEKLERSIFLLSIKENSLLQETILPHILNKPYCVFTLDRESMRFRQMMINMIQKAGTEEPLRYFLSQTKFKKQTLRMYLYSRIKNLDISKPEVYSETLNVLIDNKIETIRLSFFYIDTVIITITIENNCLNTINYYEKSVKAMKSLIQNVVIHLKSSFKQKSIRTKLILTYLQSYYNISTPKDLHLDKLDVNKTIQKIIKILKIIPKQNIKFIKSQPIIIQTIKGPMLYLLIEIFKNLDPQRSILINSKLDNEGQFILCIQGLMQLPYNRVFARFQKILVEKAMYKNGYVGIKFFKDPMVSYFNSDLQN